MHDDIEPDSPILGHSPHTQHVQRMVEKLRRGRWPVLILGETGTGKEVVARSIYSSNPAGKFIAIDCASFVGPLMESDLFGHVKGSFTGAVNAKIGLIEAANGGTAFFDEIGELPLELQAKLLRVLQEKEFRPVGSVESRRSDFRIIAATNRDLLKEVEQGRFRRDLYYRLNVVVVRLAPLRDRREDIPLFATHFLSRLGSSQTPSNEALKVMFAYDWPGNVRELENAITQMVALAAGDGEFLICDLPEGIRRPMGVRSDLAVPDRLASYAGPPPPEVVPLSELERRAILHALEVTKGDRVLAADLLGIGRATLYRKLKGFQIGSGEGRGAA